MTLKLNCGEDLFTQVEAAKRLGDLLEDCGKLREGLGQFLKIFSTMSVFFNHLSSGEWKCWFQVTSAANSCCCHKPQLW